MKALHLAIAGALAAATVLSGIYGAAATSATTLAASIATDETVRHSRSVEFSDKVRQASARYRTQARERRSTTTRKQDHELGPH